jgi:hypothetical protein
MDRQEMSLFSTLLAMVAAVTFVVMILFVLFGQVTVRKLRKNPETKDELGLEFVSGWDIINVAQALAMPKFIMRKFKNTPLSLLYADVDLLYKHTNAFDRLLGGVFYWLLMISGLSGAFLILLNAIGVFD